MHLAVATSISTFENLLPKLEQVGFDKTVIDESWEVPRDLIMGIVESDLVSNSGKTLTPAQLLEVFQNDTSTSTTNLVGPTPKPTKKEKSQMTQIFNYFSLHSVQLFGHVHAYAYQRGDS
jgi:hypothetical protein